ncbi:hypothetical protein BLA6993_04965 [Burkholderia lata]|nr:hypothetical protein BLA6993_04965 [Burkholderia lata]
MSLETGKGRAGIDGNVPERQRQRPNSAMCAGRYGFFNHGVRLGSCYSFHRIAILPHEIGHQMTRWFGVRCNASDTGVAARNGLTGVLPIGV